MFTIIGGDGKEYGPVADDLVRAWIAAGRVNLETRAKADGAAEWRRVADFPELCGPAGGAPAAPGAPLAPARAAPNLDIVRCYERSWELLKANFWPEVGVCSLVTLIAAALVYVQVFGVVFLGFLFNGVLAGGQCYYFLRKIRGQPASLGDAFAGFTRAFGPLLIAGVLVSTFMFAGYLLLVIPGVYLTVAYSLTFFLPVDKGLGPWAAMETSRRVVTRQWWRVLGLILIGGLFMILGMAAFGVGVFVALPLVTGALAYAYEDLCNPTG